MFVQSDNLLWQAHFYHVIPTVVDVEDTHVTQETAPPLPETFSFRLIRFNNVRINNFLRKLSNNRKYFTSEKAGTIGRNKRKNLMQVHI